MSIIGALTEWNSANWFLEEADVLSIEMLSDSRLVYWDRLKLFFSFPDHEGSFLDDASGGEEDV